jgi:hypothetical protein
MAHSRQCLVADLLLRVSDTRENCSALQSSRSPVSVFLYHKHTNSIYFMRNA